MPNNTQIKVTISGRVQGVFFRAETKKTADRLGIKGYVRNLPNGAVEAVFQGDRAAVAQIMAWCDKGPAAAKVDLVRTEDAEISSPFETFDIRY